MSTIKELREKANKLNFVGSYQMGKDELIEAIETVEAELKAKKAEAKKAETKDEKTPVQVAKDVLAEDKKALKEARQNLLKETTTDGVEKAQLAVKAAENTVRLSKEVLKKVKKESKGDSEFSWHALLGWGVLVAAAASIGVGAAVLTERYATASEGSGNVDNL